MQWIIDVITLRFFITPYVILLIYWLGAFIVPLAGWLLCRWVLNKLREHDTAAAGLDKLGGVIDDLDQSRSLRLYFWIGFAFVFLLMELIWRLMFEFLIAYFHIHDALMQMSRQSS